MAELGEATVAISANFDEFDKDVKGARGKLGKALGGIATGATVAIGAAMVGAGIAVTKFTSDSIKEFTLFQQGMNEVFTLLPDLTESAMDSMSQDALDFAKDMGVLPEKVIPALYQAISAGVPKENVFDFLATAQKAAVGGVTELETSVDGITSVINAYGADAISAGEASDLMFTAVKQGKTDFDQLSKSLFNVIPTASSLGVEFGDITAALAAMTAQGTPTSVATTQLRQALVELSKDGSKVSDTFNEITGQSFAEFIAEGGNLQDALLLIEDYAADSGTSISNLFSSVEAGNAALALTGSGTETFTNNLAQMEDSAGATAAAYETMNDGVGRAQERAAALMSTIKIGLGSALEPLLNKLVELGEDALPWIEEAMERAQPVIEAFANEFGDKLGPALQIIGEAFERIFEAMSGTNEEIEFMDILIATLTVALDVVVTALEATAVGFHLLSLGIEGVISFVRAVTAQFEKLGRVLDNIGDDLPDWLTPGSPTPLEIGIKGIGSALNKLPDLSSKFEMTPSFGGISDGGGVDRSTNVNVNADATINNGSLIDDALTTAFSMLRSQVKQQTAGA